MMIDNEAPLPELVLLTHGHPDHVGGLNQLANSRKRSLVLKSGDPGALPAPLMVIATPQCLRQGPHAVAKRFANLDPIVQWVAIPTLNTWYAVDGTSPALTPSDQAARSAVGPFIEFKAMPVLHTDQMLGSCMYVFRVTDPAGRSKRVIFSGDFASMEEEVLNDPDLQKANMAVLETNTIKAPGTGHSTLAKNVEILRRWYDDEDTAVILLTHLSGYEDCTRGSYDHVPDDDDWLREVSDAKDRGDIPDKLTVTIAHDAGQYPL
jgi:ribonuclease BN (tRNA processing enzyme)